MARDATRRTELGDHRRPSALTASRTILVVTPESGTAGEIVGALQARGVPTVQASTPPQALFWDRRLAPSVVVLDLTVPSARLLLGAFRAEGRLLVVLNDDADERVRALEAGCLDALTRSLEPDEVAEKLIRLGGPERAQSLGTVIAGPLTVDLSSGQLRWRDDQLAVSPLLLNLAAYLAARPGRLSPARTILQDVWGEPWASSNKVHQAVHRLRRRLGEPANSPFLVARRGHGYGVFPNAVDRDSPSWTTGARVSA